MRETEPESNHLQPGDVRTSSTYLWRAGDDFSPELIADVFDGRTPEALDHPRNGSGYGWVLPTGAGRTTRLELYPNEQVATLRFVDNAREPQNVDYLMQALRTEQTDEGSRVAIASEHERHVRLLRVYPSGEFDEHLRVLPVDTHGLPAQGTIWMAEAPPAGLRDSNGEQRNELTALETADLLGVSRPRVSQLVKEGQLRARRGPNRKLLIDAADVFAYAQSGSESGRRKQPEAATDPLLIKH